MQRTVSHKTEQAMNHNSPTKRSTQPIKNRRKRICATALALIVLISSCYGVPKVMAATAGFSGFYVEDELSIYLMGSDTQYDTSSFTVDALLALYQANSPDYKIVTKNDEILAKQGQVDTENVAALATQLQTYLDLKVQAEGANDAAQTAYYQNLYNQTLIQKVSATYQKEMNQFAIDNQVVLKANAEKQVKAQFAKQVYALISLQSQMDYTNMLLSYQQTIVTAQKAKLDQGKILQSEYDLALAEVAKTSADITVIQTSISNVAQYIRMQTGIAKTQDFYIKYDIKKIKDLSMTTFNAMVDVFWVKNLEEELLEKEISAKTNQRISLLTIYEATSNQGQLYGLEIEKLVLEKSSLTLQLELQKMEQKNQFATLKTKYEGALSRARELSKTANEKGALYNLGMATRLDYYSTQVNRDQAIYEVYAIVQQLLAAVNG